MYLKYILTILAISVLLYAKAQDTLYYEGLGILKVKKNDVVLIKPNIAYVINPNILSIGTEALDLIEGDYFSIIKDSLKSVIDFQGFYIETLTEEFDAYAKSNNTFIRDLEFSLEKLNISLENRITIGKQLKSNNNLLKVELHNCNRKIRLLKVTAGVLGTLLLSSLLF